MEAAESKNRIRKSITAEVVPVGRAADLAAERAETDAREEVAESIDAGDLVAGMVDVFMKKSSDPNRELTGSEVEMLNSRAKRYGLKVKFL